METNVNTYITPCQGYPFDFDKDEMEKCENNLGYFYSEYYSKVNPDLTLEKFYEQVNEIKNIKSVIFRWCLGRIKRRENN